MNYDELIEAIKNANLTDEDVASITYSLALNLLNASGSPMIKVGAEDFGMIFIADASLVMMDVEVVDDEPTLY